MTNYNGATQMHCIKLIATLLLVVNPFIGDATKRLVSATTNTTVVPLNINVTQTDDVLYPEVNNTIEPPSINKTTTFTLNGTKNGNTNYLHASPTHTPYNGTLSPSPWLSDIVVINTSMTQQDIFPTQTLVNATVTERLVSNTTNTTGVLLYGNVTQTHDFLYPEVNTSTTKPFINMTATVTLHGTTNLSSYHLHVSPTHVPHNETMSPSPQISESDPVVINTSVAQQHASPTIPTLGNGNVTYTTMRATSSQFSEYIDPLVETPFPNMTNLSLSSIQYSDTIVETTVILPDPLLINSTVSYIPQVIPTQTLDNGSNETLFFPLPTSAMPGSMLYSEKILFPYTTSLMQPVPTQVPTNNETIAPTPVNASTHTANSGSLLSGLEPAFSESIGHVTASSAEQMLTTEYYASTAGDGLLQPFLTESIDFAFETSLLLPTPFDHTSLTSPSLNYSNATTTKLTSSEEPPGFLLPLSMTVAPSFTVTEAVTTRFATSENFQSQMIFPLNTSDIIDNMFFTSSSTVIYIPMLSPSPTLNVATTTINTSARISVKDDILPGETSNFFNPFPTSQGVLLEPTGSIELKLSPDTVIKPSSTVYYQNISVPFVIATPTMFSTSNITEMTVNSTTVEQQSTILALNSRTVEPHSIAMVQNSTTVEPRSTIMTSNSTTVERLSNTIVQNSTTAELHSTMMASNDTPVELHSTTVVQTHTTAEPHSTTMVQNSTTVELHHTTMISNSTTVELHSTTVLQNSTTLEPLSTTMVQNSATVEPNITSTKISSGNTTGPYFINSTYTLPLNTRASIQSSSVRSVSKTLSITHILPLQEHNTSSGDTVTNNKRTELPSLPARSSFPQSTSSFYTPTTLLSIPPQPTPTSVYDSVSNRSSLAEPSSSLVPTEALNMTSAFQSTTANLPSVNKTSFSSVTPLLNLTSSIQSNITSSTLEMMSSGVTSSNASRVDSSQSISTEIASLIGQTQVMSLSSSSVPTIPANTKGITSSSTLTTSSHVISSQSSAHTSNQPVVTPVPTSSVCTPFDNIILSPPLNSIVSIILAIKPAELEEIQKPGSPKRCDLVDGLTRVFETGLDNKEREQEVVVRLRKRSQGRLKAGGMFQDYFEKFIPVREKRQLMTEQQYTAVILDISDADSIGENLAEIQFYILSISDPTAPVVVNSTTVTEIYELANVDEISGYTIVRPAQQPTEDEETMTTSSDEPIISLTLLGVAAAVVAVILVGIIAVLILLTILLCRRRKKGAFRIQVERLRTPDATRNLDIDVTTRNVNDIKVHGSGSHDSRESSHDLSELSDSSQPPSATSLTALAHSGTVPEQAFVTSNSFQYQPMQRGLENDGQHQPVTLTHLAHTQPPERNMSDKDKPVASTLEMTSHYHPLPASPRPPPPRLPPLQPRFHPIQPPSQQSPPSPVSPTPPSPSLTSTFRRLPTPVETSPPPEKNKGTLRTPHRKIKERKRRSRRRESHSAASSVQRNHDENESERFPREQMTEEQQTHIVNNDEEELWHRKRATMEYHKYLTGQDSSFHPPHLSFTKKTPRLAPTSTPIQQQPPTLLLSTTIPHSPFSVLAPQEFGNLEQQYEAYTESETALEVTTEMSDESESSSRTIASQMQKQPLLIEGGERVNTEMFSVRDQISESDSVAETKQKKSKRRKKEKSYPSKGRFNIIKTHRSSKVAPSMATPLNAATSLAWMDTVNGRQLMSLQPVPPFFRPPQHLPPLQFLPQPPLPPLPPHYLHPQPPQLELSQTHYTITSHSQKSHSHKSQKAQHSHSQKSPHSYSRNHSTQAKPHTTAPTISNQPCSTTTKEERQERCDIETKTDTVDGEEIGEREGSVIREQKRTNDQDEVEIKHTGIVIGDNNQMQTHQQSERGRESEVRNNNIISVDATPQDEVSNTIIQDLSNSHSNSQSEVIRNDNTVLKITESQHKEDATTLLIEDDTVVGNELGEKGIASTAQQPSVPERRQVTSTIVAESLNTEDTTIETVTESEIVSNKPGEGTSSPAQQQSLSGRSSAIAMIEQQSGLGVANSAGTDEQHLVLETSSAVSAIDQQPLPKTSNAVSIIEKQLVPETSSAWSTIEQQTTPDTRNELEKEKVATVQETNEQQFTVSETKHKAEEDSEEVNETGAIAGPTMEELLQMAFSTVPSDKLVNIKTPQRERRSSAKKDDNIKEQEPTPVSAVTTHQRRHPTNVNMPIQIQPVFPAPSGGPEPIMWQQQVPQYNPVMATSHHYQPAAQHYYYTTQNSQQPLGYYPQYPPTQVYLDTSRYNPAQVWMTTPYLMPPYTSTPRYRQ